MRSERVVGYVSSCTAVASVNHIVFLPLYKLFPMVLVFALGSWWFNGSIVSSPGFRNRVLLVSSVFTHQLRLLLSVHVDVFRLRLGSFSRVRRGLGGFLHLDRFVFHLLFRNFVVNELLGVFDLLLDAVVLFRTQLPWFEVLCICQSQDLLLRSGLLTNGGSHLVFRKWAVILKYLCRSRAWKCVSPVMRSAER